MPRIVREAEVSWEGNVARGAGAISAASSGAFAELAVHRRHRGSACPRGRRARRSCSPPRTAAASRRRSRSELSKAGTPPERLDVRCVVTMDEVEGKGHQIVHSEIEARGTVPDCDEAAFAQAAEAADAGCPFSALIRASATVTVVAHISS